LWHWNLLILICHVCLNFSIFKGRSTGSDYQRAKWRLAIQRSAAVIVVGWTVLSVAPFISRSCEVCYFLAVYVYVASLWLVACGLCLL